MYQTQKKIEINVTAKNVPATPITAEENSCTVPKVAASWKCILVVVYAHLAQCILNMI
jgi:hypothetical protein